ncbi:uncharacterized protein EMH_0061570 [Eimeria mitis]|uniref:Uncharacterized protein n=1 Tax=Eimeria mitis TaxID=44415 RepID=U6K8M3_9EIME|nr:uncharacterized protein EMH_0061570 [Eimeria mitis]CDJ34340.1 hypothetical protein, conserved [Eimeria mitis]
MTISDFAWGVMPPFLLVLKSFASFVGAVIGHLGYRMVQVFYRQLREPMRSPLPICAYFETSTDFKEDAKYIGSQQPRLKEARYFLPHRIRRQLPVLKGDILRLQKNPLVQQLHFRIAKNRLAGSSSTPQLFHRGSGQCKREGIRHYWTKMDSFSPFFFQAVKRRLTLWKDDMLLYATKIEDTGVWNEGKEACLFVVPNGHYGYVDCKWYLDIRLSEAIGGKVSSPCGYGMKSTQADESQNSCRTQEAKCFRRWRRLALTFISIRPRKSYRSPRGPCVQEESQWCTCLRHLCAAESHQREERRERSSDCGVCEKSVLPKIKLGIFEDSAIERWYLLWRAEHIVGFYKETCHLNLLICALQCLFGITKAYVAQCASLAVERYNHQNAAQLEFLGVRLQTPSWRRTLSAVWRPLLQFALLLALILPMKLMDRRGGKNAWKFQLLALGQAVTYVTFVFSELMEGCFMMAKGPAFTEATKIPQGVEFNFVIGSHLVLPLFSLALTVHLRRIPEVSILLTSIGSAVVTVVTLTFVGWDFKVVAFFMLSRTLYALFFIMVTRAFENVRRQLFASQVLPFLMYLSVLANSQQVQNLCAIRTERNHCGYQQAESSISAGDEGCPAAASIIGHAYSQPSV